MAGTNQRGAQIFSCILCGCAWPRAAHALAAQMITALALAALLVASVAAVPRPTVIWHGMGGEWRARCAGLHGGLRIDLEPIFNLRVAMRAESCAQTAAATTSVPPPAPAALTLAVQHGRRQG